MYDSTNAHMLLISNECRRSRKLESILGPYFSRVIRKAGLEEIRACRIDRDDIHLIIAVDSSGNELNGDFFQVLKTLFFHARIICLMDRITGEREITLRSSGIVFLGSFEQFCEHSGDILKSALGRGENRSMTRKGKKN